MSTENGDVILSQNPPDMPEQARTYVQRVQQANACEEEISTAALLAFVHARRKAERQDFLEAVNDGVVVHNFSQGHPPHPIPHLLCAKAEAPPTPPPSSQRCGLRPTSSLRAQGAHAPARSSPLVSQQCNHPAW